MLWDRGTWEPLGDPDEALKKGEFKFILHGERLKGKWVLVRLRGRNSDGKENWLLIKERDEFARDGSRRDRAGRTSVATGRSMEEIAAGKKVWHSNRKKNGAGNGAAKLERKAAPGQSRDDDRPPAQKKTQAQSSRRS